MSCPHEKPPGECDQCDNLDRLNALFETVENLFLERSWRVRVSVPLKFRASLPDNETVYLCWGPTSNGWKLGVKSMNVDAPIGSEGWGWTLLRCAPRELRILAASKIAALRQQLMTEIASTDKAVLEAIVSVETLCTDMRRFTP